MTPQEARDAARVMIAFAEGKKIEYYEEILGKWRTASTPVWDFRRTKYRVAAEPWKGKVWVRGNDTALYRESHDAEEWRNEGYRLITVKEVQDD